jgi:peptidyl-dipeptidase Dcp
MGMNHSEPLIAPWPGPYGGLPPFDLATPEAVEQAVTVGIAAKKQEIAIIAAKPDAPDFANTIEALERSGRELKRAKGLLWTMFSTKALGAIPEIQARLAPKLEALEDEIAHDEKVFARVDAVFDQRAQLTEEQARLTHILRDKMLRRGAGMPHAQRQALQQVNGEIAQAESRFHANMMGDVARYVLVETEAELDGVPSAIIVGAAKLAEERGHPGKWAIGNLRPVVWPVLQRATNRGLRRRVRKMWVTRCADGGPHDNSKVISKIASLRGKKAKLLGFESFAHWVTANRMAQTPEAALDLLTKTWRPVHKATMDRMAALQVLADEDGLGEPLKAWDWLYYVERYRQRHFNLDAEALKPYLTLDNVLAAILDAASRLHHLTFRRIDKVALVHPDVRVYEVSRKGDVIGIIYADLLFREGKMRSSWQYELRAAENFDGRVIPLSNVCSNVDGRLADGTVVMGWEYANVLFHEFGHALHMIMSEARYPSLGPMGIEWDMVELPSQLNERWLYDRALIHRHFRHCETREPIPGAMIDGIEAAFKFDRVFSVGLEYLMPAIVDMKLYLAADGSDVDALTIERAAYAEMDMPQAIDPVFYLPHQYHSFTEAYAAGVYSYLWADVMVADAIEAFEEAPGGLYDGDVSERWRQSILTMGTAVAGAEAYRNFRGRDPDPDALVRRFKLI